MSQEYGSGLAGDSGRGLSCSCMRCWLALQSFERLASTGKTASSCGSLTWLGIYTGCWWESLCWGGIRFGDAGKSECKVKKEFIKGRVAGMVSALQAEENKEEQREKESSLNSHSALGISLANS